MSDECHACLKCVSVCPEKNTPYLSSLKQSDVIKPWIYVVTIISLFLGGSLLAGVTGYWQTGISNNVLKTQAITEPLCAP